MQKWPRALRPNQAHPYEATSSCVDALSAGSIRWVVEMLSSAWILALASLAVLLLIGLGLWRLSLSLVLSLSGSSQAEVPSYKLSAEGRFVGLRASVEKRPEQTWVLAIFIFSWCVLRRSLGNNGSARATRHAKENLPEQKNNRVAQSEKDLARPAGRSLWQRLLLDRLTLTRTDQLRGLWRLVGEIEIADWAGDLRFGCADPACIGRIDGLLWALRVALPRRSWSHRAVYGERTLAGDAHIRLRLCPVPVVLRSLLWFFKHLRWVRPQPMGKRSALLAAESKGSI